jgi:hypothetical protein
MQTHPSLCRVKNPQSFLQEDKAEESRAEHASKRHAQFFFLKDVIKAEKSAKDD